jgi:hypothetical protein
VIFLKPATSVVGPNANVVYPSISKEVHHEAELAVVIGRVARHVRAEDASSYIFGLHRRQRRHGPRPAAARTASGPGPRGSTRSARWGRPSRPSSTLSSGWASWAGSTVRSGRPGSPSDMVFGVAEIVEFVSRVMTLLPGDVILTGTPAGVGPVEPGDLMEVEIDGIGTLARTGWRPPDDGAGPDRPVAHRLPCTSARPEPPSSTGSTLGTTAGSSSSGSTTPTASARPPSSSRTSSARCAGWGSTGTRGRGGRAARHIPPIRPLRRYREVAQELVESGAAYHDDRTPESSTSAARPGAERRPAPRALHPPARARPPRSGRSVWRCLPTRRSCSTTGTGRGPLRADSLDDFVILRATAPPPITWPRRSTTSTTRSPTSPGARTSSLHPQAHPPHPGDGRRAAHLRPPSPPVRHRREEAVQASRGHRRSRVPGGGLPARGDLQLPGPWAGRSGRDTIFTRTRRWPRSTWPTSQKNPAVFDPDKLEWMNGEYVRAMDPDGSSRVRPVLAEVSGGSRPTVGRLRRRWPRWYRSEPTSSRGRGPQVRFLFEDLEGYDEHRGRR